MLTCRIAGCPLSRRPITTSLALRTAQFWFRKLPAPSPSLCWVKPRPGPPSARCSLVSESESFPNHSGDHVLTTSNRCLVWSRDVVEGPSLVYTLPPSPCPRICCAPPVVLRPMLVSVVHREMSHDTHECSDSSTSTKIDQQLVSSPSRCVFHLQSIDLQTPTTINHTEYSLRCYESRKQPVGQVNHSSRRKRDHRRRIW